MAESDGDSKTKGASSGSSGFEIAGDTYSVDSSITAYRIEHGRRYHAYRDGAYWAPNDERQNESLDLVHHKYCAIFNGKLHLAPIEKTIERALDVGTGTGIWAIEFADEFPETTVLGIDLSPIQPTLVPPNCMFEVDDARDEWTYPPDYFDFIHIRNLLGSIADWDTMYKQTFRHLKPGGWIEHVEVSPRFKSDDGSVTPESPLTKFGDLFEGAGKITGQSFLVCEFMRDKIVAAGFTNVVEKIYKNPVGTWPEDPKLKELGSWSYETLDVGLEGYSLATMNRVMGWNIDEIHVLLAQVRAALRDERIHAYYDIRAVYGQKPPE